MRARELTGAGSEVATTHARPPSRALVGQLGAFAVFGAAAGTLPLPWLPDALGRRVRGALVQDLAARHGVSLSAAARQVLAEPSSGGSANKPGALGQALSYLARKLLMRFGPLAMLPPLRAGLATYVLGHLLDRYLGTPGVRDAGAVLEGPEAERLREAVDRAIIRVASPEAALDWPGVAASPEDVRDDVTRAIDGVLATVATVPSWLLHRLDAAFDDALAEARAHVRASR